MRSPYPCCMTPLRNRGRKLRLRSRMPKGKAADQVKILFKLNKLLSSHLSKCKMGVMWTVHWKAWFLSIDDPTVCLIKWVARDKIRKVMGRPRSATKNSNLWIRLSNLTLFCKWTGRTDLLLRGTMQKVLLLSMLISAWMEAPGKTDQYLRISSKIRAYSKCKRTSSPSSSRSQILLFRANLTSANHMVVSVRPVTTAGPDKRKTIWSCTIKMTSMWSHWGRAKL